MSAQSSIPQSSLQGSLFELVARGRKDAYFAVDKDSSEHVFNAKYDATTPFLQERRTTVPLNGPQFGNTFEIEIDKYGDILTTCNLLIDLPSWLPPMPLVPGGTTYPPQDANNTYWIKDASGYSYGYSDYIGYFLFERIQFYQDQALIQEWSGDMLFALTSTEGSLNTSYLGNQQTGGVLIGNDYVRTLAARATPGPLRLHLPLPGLQTPGDGGFPLCCVPVQSYRLRIKLRKLEDLIESDSLEYKPNPFSKQFEYTFPNGGGIQTVQPVTRESFGQPTIVLETLQAYIDPDVRAKLQTLRHSIPFRRPFENIFTFGPPDFAALDVSSIAASSRRLDACHLVERIQVFFRTANALDQNRYTDFTNPLSPDGQFYNQMKLIIAGRDREFLQSPMVWQDLMSYAKDEIDSGHNFSEMRWNLGDMYSMVRPFSRSPNGSINFTTADRPTLYFQLNNVPVQTISQQRKTELRAFMEGWNVYEIEQGRGRLLFAN
jgi:hypothetical protein